jgi:DNA damage-binding protein 1
MTLFHDSPLVCAGIRGVWSMKAGSMEEHDKYLVITFVEATHVLAINADDELDEAVIPGFNTDAMTLFCSSLDNDQMCQVRGRTS